jgi:hypothetical protein
MKFSIKILLILFLFTLTSSANDKLYSFLGIQSSYSDYDGVSTPTLGLKYGRQNSEWRTAISYNYADKSNDKFQSLIVQMDKGVLTDLFRMLPIKPYLGFSIGVMENKNSQITDRGYLYGLNVGLNYVLSNSFDIDLGYRQMWTSKFKYIDTRGDLSLSLHYYFE